MKTSSFKTKLFCLQTYSPACGDEMDMEYRLSKVKQAELSLNFSQLTSILKLCFVIFNNSLGRFPKCCIWNVTLRRGRFRNVVASKTFASKMREDEWIFKNVIAFVFFGERRFKWYLHLTSFHRLQTNLYQLITKPLK